MSDSFSEIKKSWDNIYLALEKMILSQKEEIASLKQRVADLENENKEDKEIKVNKKIEVPKETPIPEISFKEEEDFIIKDFSSSETSNISNIVDSAMKRSHPWMDDMPGPTVQNIEDAILLNDRLFFINQLFDGDEDQFSLTLERINETSSFKEVLNYLRSAFPEWDENSDPVYRFYMIVRRKCKD